MEREVCTNKPFLEFLWCDGNFRTLHGVWNSWNSVISPPKQNESFVQRGLSLEEEFPDKIHKEGITYHRGGGGRRRGPPSNRDVSYDTHHTIDGIILQGAHDILKMSDRRAPVYFSTRRGGFVEVQRGRGRSWAILDHLPHAFIITDKAKTRRGGGRRCRCYERRRTQVWGDWSLSHSMWSVTHIGWYVVFIPHSVIWKRRVTGALDFSHST
jgi:hypothetical protein